MRIPLLLTLACALLLTACGGGDSASDAEPLSAKQLNLVFVLSPDLAYHAPGDIDPETAHLASQGLQRSLLMAGFLQQQVLGMKNVTSIHVLAPMTHLQTAGQYPDMAALAGMQQFAMQNQMALSSGPGSTAYTGNSFAINDSYPTGSVPAGVVTPTPSLPCPSCQGLVFNDQNGDNVALVDAIIKKGTPGFHVFSAPWETISELLRRINASHRFGLAIPTEYPGPNRVYAISVTPSGSASMTSYDSRINPPTTYPELVLPRLASCAAKPFTITATGAPADINKNQTLYIVRHVEAHPTAYYANGNYVAAGQWRALGMAQALRGRISPQQVYSFDPAQVAQGSLSESGISMWSNVAPSLSVLPYAIANKLPYKLISEFLIGDANSPQLAADFLFRGGKFSNQSLLLGWQFTQIPQTIDALLASYQYSSQPAPAWSPTDYDSVWRVTIDGQGQLTIDNTLCQGIDSALLPGTAPQF